MVDIPITAAVVGGRQAVSDLDRLSARTKVAARTTQEHEAALRKRNEALRRGAAAGSALGGGGRTGSMVSGAMQVLGGGGGLVGASLAAGYAVLSTASQALTMVAEANADAIRGELQARKELATILKEGKRTRQAGALSWLDQSGRTERGLLALGGSDLAGTARDLGKHVPGASAAVLELEKAQRNTFGTRGALQDAVGTGLVTTEDATKAIIEGANTAAEILSGALQRVVHPDEVAAMLQRTYGSSIGAATAQVQGYRSRADDAQRVRAESGDAVAGARREYETVLGPELRAMRDAQAEGNAELHRITEALDKMTRWEKYLDYYFGGKFTKQALTQQSDMDGRNMLGAGF